MTAPSSIPPTGPTPRRARRAKPERLSGGVYAGFALIAFLVGAGLLIFLVTRSRDIGGAGLTGQVYYSVLLAMGAAVAFALFGVLRARASVTGKAPNVSVELGGAAAMFALVVFGGFRLVPQTDGFAFAVLLRDKAGAPAAAGGTVTMLTGGVPSRIVVDSQGRALFENLPPTFRGQDARIELKARGWQFASGRVDTTVSLAGSNTIIVVVPGSNLCCVTGVVRAETGAPVAGAMASIGAVTGQSDSAGWFKLVLPPDQRRETVRLRVYKIGYVSWDESIPVDTADVHVILAARQR